MKGFNKIMYALALGFLSCSSGDKTGNNKADNTTDTATTTPKENVSGTTTDSSKWVADDYPVTDAMFSSGLDNNFARKSGSVQSSGKAWFRNETLKQTLVFDLYTDFHRLATFHFMNDDIPPSLIERVELSDANGEPASLALKQKNFKGFIGSAATIDAKYFVSNKGFRLGDSKQKATAAYGTPESTKTDGAFEILQWNFTGDQLYDGKADLKGKPLVKDSYGHQVTLFFKNDILVGIILYNDIP